MEIKTETSKILVEEHKNILKVADAMERRCDKESFENTDEDFFRKVIDFIRNYADKFHHAKEEDILFKEFVKCAEEGCVHCNPVEQMLIEHDIGRRAVRKIEQGLDEKNLKKVKEGALEYSNIIREHIFKEDNIMYPMADDAISKEVQEKILKKFKEIEKERDSEKKKYLKFVGGL